MPIPPGQTCGNCIFIDFAGVTKFYGHEVTVDGKLVGYCRVIRPFPASSPASQPASYPADRKSFILGVNWPEVKSDDWCGDWSDKLKFNMSTLPAAEEPPPPPAEEPAPGEPV